MKRLLIAAVLALLVSGCVTAWVKLDTPTFIAKDQSYSVNVPPGWIRRVMGIPENELLITYDGPLVEFIRVNRREHDNAFKKIEKKSSQSMLAHELAELEVAEMKSDQNLANLVVEENIPVEISALPGYRLKVRMKTNTGLQLNRVVYGVANKKGYYTLTYQAPSLHYFPKYIGMFEDLVKTFSLI